MKYSNETHEQDFLLTFSDIHKIIKKNQCLIWSASLIFAFLAFFYAITRPITYQVDATFKEKGKSRPDLSQSLSSLLLQPENNDNDALILMKSRKLIEQLVTSLNLQADMSKVEPVFPLLPLNTIQQNFLVEYALLRKSVTPILKDTQGEIIAQDVSYNGEVPLTLYVEILSDNEFKLIDKVNKSIHRTSFGSLISTPNYEITLINNTSSPLSSRVFQLRLQPLKHTVQETLKRFIVEMDRNDKNLLKIAYNYPKRHEASKHVTALMDLYQKYVHQEHKKSCDFQIKYLQERQLTMGNQLEEIMQTHAQNLALDIPLTGFANYDTSMNFLINSHHNYKQKLQNIDLEMQWLKHAEGAGNHNFDKFTSSLNPDFINLLSKEIHVLKHEADSLKMALIKSLPNRQTSEESFSQEVAALEPVNRRSNKANPTPTIHNNDEIPKGIDLHTAKELYSTYSKELNELEADAAQQQFIISQINDPEFEISSLSTILNDPISNEMISKASQLIIALKDHENRTQKEQERIKSSLAIHKEFFITHLTQMVQLIELRQQLIKEKIEALQKAHLSLIQEQISILEGQMAEYISNRLSSLQREKSLYESNLLELRDEMATLPQKRVTEQLIDHQMEINRNMVEEISKLIESRNIAANLEKIQSMPLDLPTIPIHPKPPHIILITLFGAMIGAFFGLSTALAKSVINGVKASPENLRLAGLHVSGTLTVNSKNNLPSHPLLLDSDLDTLRRLISFMAMPKQPQKKSDTANSLPTNILLILLSKEKNYAIDLAQLMSKTGLKTLVINLCFDSHDVYTNTPGMLSYLEGSIKEPTIVHEDAYDIIPAGGISRFGNELIASSRFSILIDKFKNNYDWILISSHASVNSAEGESLLQLFPNAAVTITNETLDQVRHCINSHGSERHHLISFIFIDKVR